MMNPQRPEALETIVARLASRHYRRYMTWKTALIRAQRLELLGFAADLRGMPEGVTAQEPVAQAA